MSSTACSCPLRPPRIPYFRSRQLPMPGTRTTLPVSAASPRSTVLEPSRATVSLLPGFSSNVIRLIRLEGCIPARPGRLAALPTRPKTPATSSPAFSIKPRPHGTRVTISWKMPCRLASRLCNVGDRKALMGFACLLSNSPQRRRSLALCGLLMLAMNGLLQAQGPPAAQQGAALYRERCASCHDSPTGRTPSIGSIKQMTGVAIYAALTNGVMKSQTSGLSTQQVLSLLVYIAPTGDAGAKPAFEKSCTGTAPFTGIFDGTPGESSWSGWSPTVTNSRYQDAKAAGLVAADVPRLKLKWAFNLGPVGIARGQPAVAGNRVFVGTVLGDVYAIDATSGCIHWAYRATAGINSGVSVGEANGVPAIFFGDRSAVMYALNAGSGELLWKTRPAEHLLAS